MVTFGLLDGGGNGQFRLTASPKTLRGEGRSQPCWRSSNRWDAPSTPGLHVIRAQQARRSCGVRDLTRGNAFLTSHAREPASLH